MNTVEEKYGKYALVREMMETSGIIKALGSGVLGWNIGDRVTFDSTIYPLND